MDKIMTDGGAECTWYDDSNRPEPTNTTTHVDMFTTVNLGVLHGCAWQSFAALRRPDGVWVALVAGGSIECEPPIVSEAEAEAVANELAGPPVDSHVSRAYAGAVALSHRAFDRETDIDEAWSNAFVLLLHGFSARDAVDSIRAAHNLTDAECERIVDKLEGC